VAPASSRGSNLTSWKVRPSTLWEKPWKLLSLPPTCHLQSADHGLNVLLSPYFETHMEAFPDNFFFFFFGGAFSGFENAAFRASLMALGWYRATQCKVYLLPGWLWGVQGYRCKVSLLPVLALGCTGLPVQGHGRRAAALPEPQSRGACAPRTWGTTQKLMYA